MQIVESDFTMKPSSNTSALWDLTFMKRTKKRDTGKYEIEPGDTLYGLTLTSALTRIVNHRVARKYEEDNIALRDFLKEFQSEYKKILKLCRETIPENFDTGD